MGNANTGRHAMTRRDALRALLEHVEAGTATGGPDALAVPLEQAELIFKAFGDDDEIWTNVVVAHDGSVDAFIELLTAMGRGWTWFMERGRVVIFSPEGSYEGNSSETSRAGLIAIIRALIEETGE
jgi:hypothetical protein